MNHDTARDDVFTWPRLYDWASRLCTCGRHARVYATAADLLAAHAPASILDVGSGTGALAIALRHRFPASDVLGIEPGGPMVARARAKAARDGLDIDFRQGYGQQLPLDDDAVDAVTISLALHHVAEGQVPDVLAEARRVLRPGGVLLVIEFAPSGRVVRLVSPHPHGHALTEYADHVRRAGFVGVRAGRVTSRMLGYVCALAPTVPARADAGKSDHP
ncbi:MAG: class I SAM-dependent methyltransferase [Actinobacteria bacterium]|nr:class I SAM-dependent methyltransferase [Actinomycetota bacterium]